MQKQTYSHRLEPILNGQVLEERIEQSFFESLVFSVDRKFMHMLCYAAYTLRSMASALSSIILKIPPAYSGRDAVEELPPYLLDGRYCLAARWPAPSRRAA